METVNTRSPDQHRSRGHPRLHADQWSASGLFQHLVRRALFVVYDQMAQSRVVQQSELVGAPLMKPLRRKRSGEVAHDHVTDHEQILAMRKEDDTISDQGSVDSVDLNYRYFPVCGCAGDIGGRCHECRSLVCVSCFGQCEKCKVPLCTEHSRFLENEDQKKTRLCRRCYDEVMRKRRLSKVGRFMLSIFVEVDGND